MTIKQIVDKNGSNVFPTVFSADVTNAANCVGVTQDGQGLNNTGVDVVASSALPSSYTPLTLGASGTRYKAPANGYFFLKKKAQDTYNYSVATKYVNFWNNTKGYSEVYISASNLEMPCLFPCSKDDDVDIYYSFSGSTISFGFSSL